MKNPRPEDETGLPSEAAQVCLSPHARGFPNQPPRVHISTCGYPAQRMSVKGRYSMQWISCPRLRIGVLRKASNGANLSRAAKLDESV